MHELKKTLLDGFMAVKPPAVYSNGSPLERFNDICKEIVEIEEWFCEEERDEYGAVIGLKNSAPCYARMMQDKRNFLQIPGWFGNWRVN